MCVVRTPHEQGRSENCERDTSRLGQKYLAIFLLGVGRHEPPVMSKSPVAARPIHNVVTPPTTQYCVGEASISAEKSIQRRYAVREACAQSCWPCSAVAALLRWQCRQASGVTLPRWLAMRRTHCSLSCALTALLP